MFTLKKIAALAAPIALAFGMSTATPAKAQDGYVGQMMLVGFNFCPRGWATADGQLLPVAGNSALFSLIGTYYGGDGRTTFGLPDLRGRVPMHMGTGPGLRQRRIGERLGAETQTLSIANMPQHRHMVNSTFQFGDKNGPGTDFLAVPGKDGVQAPYADLDIYHNGPADRQMDPGMISLEGGSQPFDKMTPTLVMNWCIALNGTYPSRN